MINSSNLIRKPHLIAMVAAVAITISCRPLRDGGQRGRQSAGVIRDILQDFKQDSLNSRSRHRNFPRAKIETTRSSMEEQ